jgi:F-type H+-transporting ATPase subunit gamma
MAKARKIQKHMRAVKSIATVTRTMEMVSTSRFKKVHGRVAAGRPYTDRLTDIVGDIVSREGLDELDHPLLRAPAGVKRDVLLVLTSNRGLAGPYNSGVLRLAAERHRQLLEAQYEVDLQVAGRRGLQYFKYRGYEIHRQYPGFTHEVTFEEAAELAHRMMSEFLAGRISGLEVVYMQYVSSSRQRPSIAQILPMEVVEPPKRFLPGGGELAPYEYAPSSRELLRHLLPSTVRLRLYQCLLDATASEQVMRIGAMAAASKNANDMIRDLSVQYNRTRQSQITTELAEIMGGRQALDK